MVLVPVEFGTFLTDEDNDIAIGNESAAIVFAKDPDYAVKNTPLDLYVKFKTDRDDSLKITSKQDGTIDNETAVRIEGSKNDTSANVRLLDYLVSHNNEPYHFRYMADVNDYDKYLPEFEAMIKSLGLQD